MVSELTCGCKLFGAQTEKVKMKGRPRIMGRVEIIRTLEQRTGRDFLGH